MRHLRLYRAIRLIHQQGSIRKAAEILAVSPSALNRSVQGFEDEMGVAVFDRIAGGVRLSPAGELLFDLILRHLAEFDLLREQITGLRDGLSGHLRLSLGADLDGGLALDALAEFEAAHPGVHVEVVADDTAGALVRRAVDLAMLTSPQTDDSVEVLHACAVPLVARQVGGGDRAGGIAGLWDIAARRLLLPPEGTGTRAAISHLLRRNRLAEPVSTTISAAQLGRRLGAGIGMPPDQAPDQASGRAPGPAPGRAPGRAPDRPPAPGGAIAIFPSIAVPDAAGADPLPIALGQVQCSLLRAARVPMSRPAQILFAILQRRLDAATPPAPPQRPAGARAPAHPTSREAAPPT